jgi:hypothetical protein
MEDANNSLDKLKAFERERVQDIHDTISRAVNAFAGIGYKIAEIKYNGGGLEIKCWPPEKEFKDSLKNVAERGRKKRAKDYRNECPSIGRPPPPPKSLLPGCISRVLGVNTV